MRDLTVITGPVSSNKSTWAVVMAKTSLLQGNTIVVRPTSSMRPLIGESQGVLVTKAGFRLDCIDVDLANDLFDLPDADCYVIEEPAIFPDDHEKPVVYMAVMELRQRARVIVVGLGATSEGLPFGKSMGLLMQVADNILFMRGLCNWCGNDGLASRSVYMNPTDRKDGAVKVGGTESYRPACVDCYNKVIRLEPEGRLRELHLSLTVKLEE